MKPSRILLGVAVVSACLAAGSARVAFCQLDAQRGPAPTPIPVVLPQKPAPPPGIVQAAPVDVIQFPGGGAVGVQTAVPVSAAAQPALQTTDPQGFTTSGYPPTNSKPQPPPQRDPVMPGHPQGGAPMPTYQQPATQPSIPSMPAAPKPVAVEQIPHAAAGEKPIAAPVVMTETPGETTAETPAGRQEPAVSIEWSGPATARLGQPSTYQLVAKNISNGAVHNVIVRHRVPNGVRATGSEPRPINSDAGVLTWDLGTLLPAQEKRIDLQLLPDSKTLISCQAQVTFTGTALLKVQVREPKLVLKVHALERVVLGDTATVALTVTNPGDGLAERVKLKTVLGDGLEHSRGKTVEVELGNLAAGDTRTVQLVCLAKTAGSQAVECLAVADAGLTAQDTAKLDVVLPRIDLALSGPKLRYLDRPATYALKVTNPGSAPASNVSVVHVLPQGFKFHAASSGGRHDFTTRTVTWFIGDLTPGESREVSVETVAAVIGDHKHHSVATAARGLKTECEAQTRVEGLSALLMELVDTNDPVEVGADTSYEIRVTNTGSKTETNLELVCSIPDKMEFRGAKSMTGCRFRVEGRDIIFEALPKLAPRADAIYRVNVRGVAAGDMRFRARIRADGLSEPVLREESTKVYGDDVIPRQ